MPAFKSLLMNLYYDFYMSVIRPVYNLSPNKKFKNTSLELNNAEKKIFTELKDKGISITHVDALFPTTNLQNLISLANQELEKPENKIKIDKANKKISEGRGKYYNVQFWNGITFQERNELANLLLQDSIVKIATFYLKTYCKMYYLDLWYNIPTHDKSILSQKWHRDPDDLNCVKVFLYLNDVDDTMGPFSYIPKTPFGNTLGNIFPRGAPGQSGPSPEQIDEQFGEQGISCTGSAGTIIFCDTTGLHKGGHTMSKPRYLLNVCFRSNGSYWRYSKEHKDSIANFRDNNFSSELVQYSVQ